MSAVETLFDSSVLVPVLYGDHPHHQRSVQAFLGIAEEDGCCALATLGEVYVVLSGLPVRPRITGAEATAAVRQIREAESLAQRPTMRALRVEGRRGGHTHVECERLPAVWAGHHPTYQ